MSSNSGKSLQNTWQQMLQIGTNNIGVTSSLQTVQDGAGNASALQLSTTALNVNGTLTVNGSPISQAVTLTGAVTGTGTGTVATSLASNIVASTNLQSGAVLSAAIGSNQVTYAKIQQASAVCLIGNATGSTANVAEITLDSTLGFSGSTIRRAALTGDITASAGSNTTTLATVNSNTGSFGTTTAIPVITVNGKGLITAVTTAMPSVSATVNNSNTGLTTDSSGRNTQPNQTMFYATTAGHSAVTGDLTTYTCIFETTSKNIGSAYNTSTGVFTAPVAGTYIFSAAIDATSLNSSNTNFSAYFNSSGGTGWISYTLTANSTLSISSEQIKGSSYVVYLAAGGTCNMVLDVRGNGSNNVGLGSNSFFSGILIG